MKFSLPYLIRFFLFFTFPIFLCNACSREKPCNYTIESSKLKSPIQIKGFNKGAIFFETSKRRFFIGNKPISKKESKENFQGVWKIDNRKITVEIKFESHNYIISLAAEPSDRIKSWGIAIEAEPNEYFTGLLERVVDGNQARSWRTGQKVAMDLRGQKIDMVVKSTLSLYSPFFISSRGYGLFTHGTWKGEYQFPEAGQTGTINITFGGPSLKKKLYIGKPSEVVKAHLMHTGPQFLPPKWVFFPWRWRNTNRQRNTYYDGSQVNAPYNSDVVEDILMMEALGIPCRVLLVDRPWAEGGFGYDDFKWDRHRFPNPEKMIKWLNIRGINIMLWICPWPIGPKMSKEANEKGYKPQGVDIIDFSNPRAVEWWQQTGLKKVLDAGVAGFKLDRGEERSRKALGKIYDGRDWSEAYNDYMRMYAKAVFEICKEVRGNDFCLLSRSGYVGSARYTTFWGGDTLGTDYGLRSAIIAGLRSSIIGYTIWGSDTGGYFWRNADITCRWLAYSCFCPIMEVGPTANKGLWELGDEVTAVWRLYAILHSRLADYSYECARETNKTGIPIMRPLFLIYPDQEEAWKDWQTYLYGPDILVSPIWRADKKVVRKVYLPAREKWVDAWDKNNVYEGGKYVSMECPLHKIPIFIRKGSNVNLGDLNRLWKESVRIVKNKPNMSELEKIANFIN